MNVIMPTAMVTMHADRTQSESSARTAQRGIRILKSLLGSSDKTCAGCVLEQVRAIQTVATSTSETSSKSADGFGKKSKAVQVSSYHIWESLYLQFAF